MSGTNTSKQSYADVKSVFEEISKKFENCIFTENPETMTVSLKVTEDSDVSEYYYIYGNTRVYLYNADDELESLPTEPVLLRRIISGNFKNV
jgi:hypothetical protein